MTADSGNCTTKHQATDQRFKNVVRIFKNMRNRMIEAWYWLKASHPPTSLKGRRSAFRLTIFGIRCSRYAATRSSIGSIKAGKLADLLVLERNLFDVATHDIGKAVIRSNAGPAELAVLQTGRPYGATISF